MKRQEAMALLISKPNTKIIHISFSKGDFIYVNDNNEFKDEDNNFLIWDEFWYIRKGGSWENDWFIIE